MLALLIVGGLPAGAVWWWWPTADEREAACLRYQNTAVYLQGIVEGGVLDSETTPSYYNTAYWRRGTQGAPSGLETRQIRQLYFARREVLTRGISESPVVAAAWLDLTGQRSEHAALRIVWVETDQDTVGIMVRETRPDGGEIVEEYPVVEATPGFGFSPFGYYGDLSFSEKEEPGACVLRLRKGGERKDDRA